MDIISKEKLLKWIKKQEDKGNWLQVSETGTQLGRLVIYVTLAGQFVAVQYDLTGDVAQVAPVVAIPQGQSPLGFKPPR